MFKYANFFFFLFFFQLIFIFWGIDFSDMGFSAISYELIFDDPEAVKYYFMYWLGAILGGIWLKLVPWAGIVGLRLFGLITFTVTLIVVFELLKNEFNESYLKKGLLLVTLLFGPHWAFIGFHYDTLSALFFVVMITALYKGLISDNFIAFAISGFFLCLNVFVRAPNIAGAGILLMVFYFGFYRNYDFGRYLKILVSFTTGFLLGLIIMVLMLKFLHQDVIFYEILLDTLAKGKGDTSHNLFSLAAILLSQYWFMIKAILGLTVIFLVLLFVVDTNRFVFWVLSIFLIGYALYYIIAVNDFTRANEWLVYHSLVLLFSVIMLFDNKYNLNQRTLVLAGILMLAILPLGCSHGFINMAGLVLIIALPVSVSGIFNVNKLNLWNIPFINSIDSLQILRKWLGVVVIIISIFPAVYYSYCEENGKYKLTSPVNSRQVKMIYTTKKRADAINELLQECKKHVAAGDYTLAYGYIPMFYYLTETKPFLYNLWIGDYKVEYYKNLVNKSLAEKKYFPVIVKMKYSTWGNWPSPETKFKDVETNEWDKYFDEFVKRNSYSMVWQNEVFELWKNNAN